MTSITALLRRCQATPTDDTAWSEFWSIVKSAALYPVQEILREHGLQRDRAVDVLQELFLHLREDCWACLAAFRGTTEGQLRGFLRSIARNFAKNWASKQLRERKQEEDALRGYVPSEGDGPTEHEIESTRQEVEALMSTEEREKLRSISGGSEVTSDSEAPCSPPPPVPKRTLRQWRVDLVKKYGSRV